MSTQLEKLAEIISLENSFKLQEYIWWSKHSFIKRVSISSEKEFDDNGGLYDSYILDYIGINNPKGFVDYLIESKSTDVINELFILDNEIKFREVDLLDMSSSMFLKLYSRAALFQGNETDYDLHYILSNWETIDFSIFHQNKYLNTCDNPGKIVIEEFVSKLLESVTTLISEYGR